VTTDAAGGGGAPLSVALLNPTYWPEVRRGSERFARDLAGGLLERGHRPVLITSHRHRPSRTVEDGLEVRRVWRPPDGRLRRRLFEEHLTHVPLSFLELVRVDPDVAQALYPTDGVAAARWSERTGRPAILSYMGIPHRLGLANRRGRLELTIRAVRGARAVVALSRAAAEGFRRWLGVEARVIPPGVDLETFSPGGERAPEPTILCSADAAEPRKRVDLLVRALALVRRERGDARLVLSRPRSRALAAELARVDGVQLADLDDTADLVAANRAAWVAALPSVGEAFGLVLVEAMACGTPVVAADREALPELVDRPEVGRLFAGDEPEALARALLDAFDLAHEPAAAEACRVRASEFPRDRCAASYEALYRELLAARE
jgi:glycosyltransferase involved in cell wall biosynthesis